MFNRQIEITRENESILFINAVIENLRYGIISLDMMINCDEESVCQNYYDEHTFYFFHMQSVLTAQGNIYNVLYNDFFDRKIISRERVRKIREAFGIDLSRYPLVGNKKFRNTNAHFDERYYQYNGVGDMNLLKSDTPANERNSILSTLHLRTIDVENWIYYSYDGRGRQISLDLRELRNEMYDMLVALCTNDIRAANYEERTC